jgi:hypothetical protein
MRFANVHLGNPLEEICMPRSLGGARPELVEGSLADLVLNKIEAHPDGILAAQIKDWVRSGSSKYAGKAEAGKRVDTTLTRLKRRNRVVIKKDDGKWYPVTDGAGDREKAA